ncbi:unnamed protein product, partial [marine sediment metagenome]
MKKEQFDKLVEEALANIPKKYKKYLDNLAVIVENKPSREIYKQTRANSGL